MIKQCIVCGKEFTTNYPNKLICSPECKRKRQLQHNRTFRLKNNSRIVQARACKRKPVLRENHCYHCGKPFKQTFTNEKFCSDDCRIDYFGLNEGYNLGSLFAKILHIEQGGWHSG